MGLRSRSPKLFMSAGTPILTSKLFPILEGKLVELLRSLSAEQWALPTLAKQWTVKDIAAHLLDGNLKRLSIQRDGFFGLSAPPNGSYDEFIAFINRNNAEWVQAARRLSPRTLTDLIEITSRQVAQLFAGLDPYSAALWSVSWAGEEVSANWFDIAREYTERWHHQEQIRVAVQQPGISTRELLGPVLETFVRGLPHAFRGIDAEPSSSVELEISGAAGGRWFLEKTNLGWRLISESKPPAAKLRMDQELAWRVFTKAVDPKTARVQVEGDVRLALHILSLVAVLA